MTPSKAIAAPGMAGPRGTPPGALAAIPPGVLPQWMQSLPLEILGQMAVPIAVLGIVIALITPLPSFVLDLLIVTDILVSVIVLMVSLYLVRPVEFTSFPTTLLLLTLFRLALN
ncbi:MAG TPA: FHIPEP family type III secretion protein, partial [Bryobacteraceae bacterium]|nr:FHIPEP family type III secretion protein [Bryobacteraceae bacterium]